MTMSLYSYLSAHHAPNHLSPTSPPYLPYLHLPAYLPASLPALLAGPTPPFCHAIHRPLDLLYSSRVYIYGRSLHLHRLLHRAYIYQSIPPPTRNPRVRCALPSGRARCGSGRRRASGRGVCTRVRGLAESSGSGPRRGGCKLAGLPTALSLYSYLYCPCTACRGRW